jgi:hypothetical protein
VGLSAMATDPVRLPTRSPLTKSLMRNGRGSVPFTSSDITPCAVVVRGHTTAHLSAELDAHRRQRQGKERNTPKRLAESLASLSCTRIHMCWLACARQTAAHTHTRITRE